MNKEKVLFIGVLFLLATSLYFNFDSSRNGFARKLECGQYRSEIDTLVNESFNHESSSVIANLEKVFYSPKRQSCLYSVHLISRETMESKGYILSDYLTAERLLIQTETETGNFKEKEEEYM